MQWILKSEHSHHFQASCPGVVAPGRNDLTGVIPDVPRPRLADQQGPVLLYRNPGAAGWIYHSAVLLPQVPEYYSVSVIDYSQEEQNRFILILLEGISSCHHVLKMTDPCSYSQEQCLLQISVLDQVIKMKNVIASEILCVLQGKDEVLLNVQVLQFIPTSRALTLQLMVGVGPALPRLEHWTAQIRNLLKVC